MKLSSWVLALYFRSEEGAKLVEGFERLLSDAAGAEGEDTDEECAPDEEAAESLAPEEEARLAVDACFSEVTHCVRRTLDELGWSPPSSAPEARALCERLFEHGLVVEDQDIEAFLSASEPGSTDDDGGEEHGEPDDAEVDETVDDEPAEDAELRLGAESDDSARLWAANIGAISWALHAFAPEWFAPYAFAHAFNRFEAICDEFGIALPRLPGKASYVERARYYLEVNEALQEFRNEFEMTPVGFDAFLYGFCFEQVPLDEAPELPPAERAWFLMADPETDFEMLDEADDETRHHWQGHTDMRPGDIGVMWCRSPRSSVHSIWRVTSRGFLDPFAFYYRQVWIGHATLVPAVPFRELAQDPTWAAKPATKAHFQGASGREVTFEEYEALKVLLAGKGFDVGALPAMHRRPEALPEDIASERDVEERLLEPLLPRLGFTPKDWVRQYPLRMGRGDRVYPDYVFGASGKRGDESAKFLVEAKLRIASATELREAYRQARSYAARLWCEAFVLCAREGLWLFERGRSFDAERHTHFTWRELGEATSVRKLEDAIGKQSPLWKATRRDS